MANQLEDLTEEHIFLNIVNDSSWHGQLQTQVPEEATLVASHHVGYFFRPNGFVAEIKNVPNQKQYTKQTHSPKGYGQLARILSKERLLDELITNFSLKMEVDNDLFWWSVFHNSPGYIVGVQQALELKTYSLDGVREKLSHEPKLFDRTPFVETHQGVRRFLAFKTKQIIATACDDDIEKVATTNGLRPFEGILTAAYLEKHG